MSKKYQPYTKGFLKVSDGHELYFEGYGNPKGVPILYVHGGPGSGFADTDKKPFNPKKHHVILFEQRGSGRSRPFASLKNNTTPKLVEDMCALLDKFQVKKVVLYGGSWGSTLALVFAIQHPERVAGMSLRALFLGSKEAVDYYVGGGLKSHFPEKWERFVSLVPKAHQKNPSRYYLSQMNSSNAKVREKFCYEWAYYELSIVSLNVTHSQVLKYMKAWSYRSLAPLEAHYMANYCFLPEKYILKNAHRLRKIPVSLKHGRYDVICPPEQAWALKKALPEMDLKFYVGGHFEPDKKSEAEKIKDLGRLINRARF
jgi:proline iminopeptidase